MLTNKQTLFYTQFILIDMRHTTFHINSFIAIDRTLLKCDVRKKVYVLFREEKFNLEFSKPVSGSFWFFNIPIC